MGPINFQQRREGVNMIDIVEGIVLFSIIMEIIVVGLLM